MSVMYKLIKCLTAVIVIPLERLISKNLEFIHVWKEIDSSYIKPTSSYCTSMQELSDVFVSPLPDSPYVKPFRLNYTQNGKSKNWDLLEVHDSVAIIVFNVSRKVVILVKQFRPAIYYCAVDKLDRATGHIDTNKYPAALGLALELCAGIIDKDKPHIEIAQEEVLEECGYDVPVKDILPIISYRSGVGTQGSMQHLYYCEVTDSMKKGQGGGIDDEIIEVVEMKISEVEAMLASHGPLSSPPSCLFGLSWFLKNKAKQFQ